MRISILTPALLEWALVIGDCWWRRRYLHQIALGRLLLCICSKADVCVPEEEGFLGLAAIPAIYPRLVAQALLCHLPISG